MVETLTKEEFKKYVKRIRRGTRTNLISLTDAFLEEKDLALEDWVDVRTWTKVDKESLEIQKKV